jgi:hypothetical protein
MRALSVAGTAVIAAITFCLVSLLTRRGRSASRCVERALAKFAERPIRGKYRSFLLVHCRPPTGASVVSRADPRNPRRV